MDKLSFMLCFKEIVYERLFLSHKGWVFTPQNPYNRFTDKVKKTPVLCLTVYFNIAISSIEIDDISSYEN